MSSILLKECPRDRGDLVLERDLVAGPYYNCIQCGNILYIDEIIAPNSLMAKRIDGNPEYEIPKKQRRREPQTPTYKGN